MQRFTDLRVWQRSQGLAVEIYRVTRSFPAEERFCLTSQLRRAAISVPTNIAEGSKRRTSQDYARFLNLAEGSLAEVECLLMLIRELDLLTPAKARELLAEADQIARMLSALRSKVEKVKTA